MFPNDLAVIDQCSGPECRINLHTRETRARSRQEEYIRQSNVPMLIEPVVGKMSKDISMGQPDYPSETA